ncbi:hypothetical protein [Sphingomonas aquatilis]
MKRAVLACAALATGLGLIAPPASAQLLSDRVVDNRRLCLYVGSDQSADGQIVPRNTIVPASQPCPDIAPYRDPNRPVPGNAMLTRETTDNGRRQCVYTQGGVDYTREVAITQRCATTPDLLERAIAARDPGTGFAQSR